MAIINQRWWAKRDVQYIYNYIYIYSAYIYIYIYIYICIWAYMYIYIDLHKRLCRVCVSCVQKAMSTCRCYSVRGRPVRNPSTSSPALLQKKCSNQAIFRDDECWGVCNDFFLLFTYWGCFEGPQWKRFGDKLWRQCRFNWLMWVWFNLPALEIACTFFTPNAYLRTEAANLLSRNSLFVVSFPHHGMRKQRGCMQFRWDQGTTSSCWGGTKDGEDHEDAWRVDDYWHFFSWK